ncbi:MAG: hypothetical protein H0V52_03400, partial [Acidimicrobiia bacterium]|nr:hypothetical protein [Acidimicrobiia bacterium]
FGSSSAGDAHVLDVDLASLGYEGDDVAQFSYAGGRVPQVGSLSGVPTSEYGPEDANGDLTVAGERLADLLDAIAAAHPGVPVDVIAHSQGGIVARLALAERDPAGEAVANLITLGSPHHGADVATANALLGTTTVGEVAQGGVDWVSDGSTDGTSTAAAQLAETSGLLSELNDEPLPEGTRVTSIAARGRPHRRRSPELPRRGDQRDGPPRRRLRPLRAPRVGPRPAGDGPGPGRSGPHLSRVGRRPCPGGRHQPGGGRFGPGRGPGRHVARPPDPRRQGADQDTGPDRAFPPTRAAVERRSHLGQRVVLCLPQPCPTVHHGRSSRGA